VTSEASSTFREIRDTLEPLRERSESARAALDLLERDLLPRSAGGDSYAVVGIVGPNNSGKSALFNSLAGNDLSPSKPTGGATRRLIGVLHPDLRAKLQDEPTLSRFHLREIEAVGTDRATERGKDPAEVLVATDDTLPPHIMLIDTPDFDSILDNNRLASESLLAVADLVVAVVTRHSYQNRAVVEFLEGWLAHGRPWLLVYNEAADRNTADAHSAKLAADVGTEPLERYWAPHDLRIQSGEAQLTPRAIGDPARSLHDALFDLSTIAEVKNRAFDAARARLLDTLESTRESLAGEATNARAIQQVVDEASHQAASRIASTAMPGGPFVEAFRNVLDRRTNFLSRGWRKSLRQVRLGIESLPALWRGNPRDDAEELRLENIEQTALREVWPHFWEDLARDLGHESRHLARATAAPEIAAALERDLAGAGAGTGTDNSASARGEVARALQSLPAAEIGTFRKQCEDLVDAALEARGFDIDIQAAADVATLVPIALAAAVIVNTGGFGSDVAAAGGGALSSFLVEKYYHLLGRGVLVEAQRRWTELRGNQLAEMITAASMPTAAVALGRMIDEDDRLVAEIQRLEEKLAG